MTTTLPTTGTPDPAGRRVPRRPMPAGSYIVALILAIGMSIALNLLVLAVVWDAIFSAQSGISENATQILTGWGGGVLGVIGAVVGYQAGAAATTARDAVSR